MNGNIEKWVDTHVHIDLKSESGLSSLMNGLEAVFAKEKTDLHFIASPGLHWVHRIRASEDGVMHAHDLLHKICETFPDRIHGSCMVNPHYPKASLMAMEQCFEQWNFVQLGECVTYLMDYRMNTKSMADLVKRAIDYKVPIHVHVSTSNAKPQGQFSSGEEELNDMLDLMDQLPAGKYVLAHGIGAPLIHPPVVETYLGIIDKRYGKWPDNIWIEIMHFHAEGVKNALSYIPENRVMAGTDWVARGMPPYPDYGSAFGPAEKETPYKPEVSSLVEFLSSHGATDEAIRLIAYQNAFDLYNL